MLGVPSTQRRLRSLSPTMSVSSQRVARRSCCYWWWWWWPPVRAPSTIVVTRLVSTGWHRVG
uniref:Uncharacterized protein n=1 Tax=Arundo donax TaxID=35708 RepID=A0A0A9B048_ARUDO